MADVVAETRTDGIKDDSDKDSKIEGLGNEKSDEPAGKKAKYNSMNDSKTTNDVKDDTDANRLPRGSRNNKAQSKRTSTMSKLAEEGEALLKKMGHKTENPESERRQTRSQTRGTPHVAAQKPVRKEAAKSSRRGRPRKDDKGVKAEKDEVKQEEKKDEDEGDEEEKEEASDENMTTEGTKDVSQAEDKPADENAN